MCVEGTNMKPGQFLHGALCIHISFDFDLGRNRTILFILSS